MLERNNAAAGERGYQLRYSALQPSVHDEESRRRKARKIVSILRDALPDVDLGRLRLLDVGASTGYLTDELATVFGEVLGIDIDEPGVQQAQASLRRSNARVVLGDAMAMPFPNDSFDVVVANHVYEHVPDPVRLVAEMRRVLRPNGVIYFSACNRLTFVEPHYRLPFLSWLPARMADAYLRLARRGDRYYERMMSRRGVRRLLADLNVADYTLRVIREPERFAATDLPLLRLMRRAPTGVLRLALVFAPTYLFVLRERDT
jgi:SAM-dependent methyltransferase